MNTIKAGLETVLATSQLWTKDAWGNYKTANGEFRLRLQDKVIRVERKTPIEGYTQPKWIKIQSNYYSKIKLNTERRSVLIVGSKAIKL